MDRGSDKHSPRVDEELARETQGLVHTGHQSGEEWLEAEPSGEDQPAVDLSPGGPLHGGLPEGVTEDDLEGRADLALLLGKEIWPAEGSEVQRLVREHGGSDAQVGLVSALPPGRVYDNLAEVWEDLTGVTETHRF